MILPHLMKKDLHRILQHFLLHRLRRNMKNLFVWAFSKQRMENLLISPLRSSPFFVWSGEYQRLKEICWLRCCNINRLLSSRLWLFLFWLVSVWNKPLIKNNYSLRNSLLCLTPRSQNNNTNQPTIHF